MNTCSCCCDCINCDETEEHEEKTTTNVSKTEASVEQTKTTTISNEAANESSIAENTTTTNTTAKEEETTDETEETELASKNYKISYCCCGKNCHMSSNGAFGSLTDLKESGPTAKYDINYVKPRKTRTLTRAHSAMETSRSRSRSAKSRSPSAGRPKWIPTGANQYYNTHSARSSLMSAALQKNAHDSSTTGLGNKNRLIQMLQMLINCITLEKIIGIVC